MKQHLTLDPVIEKQLQSYETELSSKIQDYLDHPEKLPKFMDFRVDYAFKYILGHKPVLLKLLNDVLPVEVSDIEYLPNEIPVVSPKEKRAAFDVICKERHSGERFITEMQCLPDTDMDDRLLFYGSSLIHRQVERGSKTYMLKPVYVLCVADYERSHAASVGADQFFFHYSLREATHPDDGFSRKLQFFFLELPRLGKIWDSLETNLERWCYLFGNLNNFAEKPRDPAGFDDVFNLARTGELDGEGLKQYISTMLNEYEKYTYGEYARREGYKEGREDGREEERKAIAQKMTEKGIDKDTIFDITGVRL